MHMTSDLHEDQYHLQLASAVLLTKIGSHKALINTFDPDSLRDTSM